MPDTTVGRGSGLQLAALESQVLYSEFSPIRRRGRRENPKELCASAVDLSAGRPCARASRCHVTDHLLHTIVDLTPNMTQDLEALNKTVPPDMDLQEFRANGHRLVDLLADHLETIGTRPLFPEVKPEAVYDDFAEPLPGQPTPLAEVIDTLEAKLLPHVTQVNHPGYFGYITPTPTPAGILADFVASALNQNLGLYSLGPAAVAIERRTIRWLADLVGYGAGAGGNLTSGGMMANLIALKLARDWASDDRTQGEGVREPMAVYTSEERHVSIDKAVDVVGIGRENLRIIPTDERFTVRLEALEEAIAADRARGILPVCIVGMGGSTNTGSVDPLRRLREIADREGIWLHVDAAYGGGMLLSRANPGVLDGVELADSVTLDPHKWFFAPLDAGAVLLKNEKRLTRSFGMRPAYLTEPQDGRGERYDYFVHGLEQSRRFRSLKVWMAFKRYGTDRIGEWVDANVAQAKRLYELAEAHPDFVTAREPDLSAVCLRYSPATVPDEELSSLHARVARRVEESGRFWISTTELKGDAYFRVNPVNFRTRIEDIDELFRFLVRVCAEAIR
ncbi:MAG: aminotransferase class I/II-fold pyridoxal phosphate-dependent enzyme [Gemmatimonas sp.]|nr:aminotransferase class I/II-fold pyridoxal phosphate-dependent enzyme [Gemmatimonas sp.]